MVESGDPDLFILDHSPPKSSGFICYEKSCCASQSSSDFDDEESSDSCSITTDLDSFHVLVYGHSNHGNGTITFKNVLTVETQGKF